jgi:hypothetical protein
MNTRIRLHVAVLFSLCALGVAAPGALAHGDAAGTTTAAKGAKEGGRQASKLSLRLKGLKHGKLTVGSRIKALGTMRPYVEGQKVTVLLHRGKKKTIKRVTVPVKRKSKKSALGQFEFSKRLIQPGRYSVEAIHAKNATLGGSKTESRRFHMRYPT